jgi:hypothetical protein
VFGYQIEPLIDFLEPSALGVGESESDAFIYRKANKVRDESSFSDYWSEK